jgi:hypothetical protein
MAAAGSHSRSSSAGSNRADPGGGQQQRSNRPGQGLFRAMQKGLMGLGSKLQQGFEQSPRQSEAGDSQQQLEQSDARAEAADVIKQQWLQLSQLCWCPVLAEAPEAALPWRTASSSRGQGAGVQRLAAPCAVRPGRDLWLCSAVKAVVDGECRSQVALAGLGW